MARTSLSIVLVIAFAFRAAAADRSEKGQAPRPSALPVTEVLERAAKSPLGPAGAGLLRAVADLVEKEQVAGTYRSATVPAAVRAAPPIPTPTAVPTEKRKRLVIRLRHSPVVDVAKALVEFLDREREGRGAFESSPKHSRAVLVPEPLSNSLLVSGLGLSAPSAPDTEQVMLRSFDVIDNIPTVFYRPAEEFIYTFSLGDELDTLGGLPSQVVPILDGDGIHTHTLTFTNGLLTAYTLTP